MERDEAVRELPVTYQQVLGWLAEGRSEREIGADLGIDRRAIDALIELAQAKLARVTDRGADPNPEDR